MEAAADLEGATDAAGRKMEHRGEMETSIGDEDKNVHERRPGKTLQTYWGAKGEARAKIREQK